MADAAQNQFTALRTAITALRDSWKRPGWTRDSGGEPPKRSTISKRKLTRSRKHRPPISPWERRSPNTLLHLFLQRVTRLMTAIDGYALKPTDNQLAELKELRAEMPGMNAKIKQLIDEDLPLANKAIDEAGVPFLSDLRADRTRAPNAVMNFRRDLKWAILN